MNLNFTYTANVPAAAQNAASQFATYIDTNFTNNITVNILLDFTPNGGVVSDNFNTHSFSYDSIRSAISSFAPTADDNALLNGSMPVTDPNSNNHSGYFLTTAQQKALGFLAAADPGLDDTITFNSTSAFDYDRSDGITPGAFDFIGLLANVVSGSMGRFMYRGAGDQYTLYDLMDFGSFSVHNWTGNASASYFSIDNGQTNLNNFDSGTSYDWKRSTAGNDAFSAVSTFDRELNYISPADLRVLDVLGYHRVVDDYGSAPQFFAPATIGTLQRGNIDSPGDTDWFQYFLTGDVEYQFRLSGADTSSGTLSDPQLTVRAPGGAPLAFDDDGGPNLESLLRFTPATTGDYFVEAKAFQNAIGTYALLVQKVLHPSDFSGDGYADILFRNNSTGDTGYTDVHNNSFHSLGGSPTSQTVVGAGDFNGDGFSDILWRNNSTGDTGYSDIHNNAFVSLGGSSASYSIVGVGDFNRDGFSDILWRNNSTGDTGWSDNHNGLFHSLGGSPTSQTVVGVGDFNDDGFADVLWRNNSTGDTGWLDVHGNAFHSLGGSPTSETVVGVGDFNPSTTSHASDILWRNNSTGDTGYSDIVGNRFISLGSSPVNYSVVAVGDYNRDDFADILWRDNSTGDTGWADVHNNVFHSLGGSSTSYMVMA